MNTPRGVWAACCDRRCIMLVPSLRVETVPFCHCVTVCRTAGGEGVAGGGGCQSGRRSVYRALDVACSAHVSVHVLVRHARGVGGHASSPAADACRRRHHSRSRKLTCKGAHLICVLSRSRSRSLVMYAYFVPLPLHCIWLNNRNF